ncbi:FIST N-terminal domain-containing protein [Sulfurimonas paralvinellae]|uniref:histidine kinase n=1 Tax=Sulfurimonas paralvinellae TaxID=317658 RepID=A0A7M1B7V7_9BACT|nr:FIST N-terminal domain-containing protein [Sulfurimonas paralvinellae]QOP45526.1 GHKL domain-containing protein [Sulfurimonas paralvinellae]
MQTRIYVFNKQDTLDIININEKEEIDSAFSILIQLFSGEDEKRIEQILDYLSTTFPKATIITASTDGEIANESVLTESSVAAISTFTDTTIEIAYTKEIESFDAGRELAEKLSCENTKLLITFANGLHCNGEEFLNGIGSVNADLVVAGGLTGDNAKFQKCYVGINSKLYDRGAVAIVLNSNKLQVDNFYSFGWQTIGLKHTITKAKKNRVYTIDGISAVAFYKKYLGDEIANLLPETGIEFPLIIEKDGFKKARAITSKYEDGSLGFAGNLNEGEKVYLGIGKAETILSNPLQRSHHLNVESFFIYSCMARRHFLPDRIGEEIEPFAALAPTSGFFTYGEFFTHKKPELLNQTLTAVALSETPEKVKKTHLKQPSKTTTTDRTFQALRHILDVTSQELHLQTVFQKKINDELEAKTATLDAVGEMANLGHWELDLSTMKISWSNMNYKIFNIDPSNGVPSYFKLFHMVVKEDRKKLLQTKKILLDGEIHSLEIRMKGKDDTILHILISGKIVFNQNKPVKIIGTILDLTDIRMQDALLIQQSKSAQMGEMINMVAHQWRQPLNAISAAAIKLSMQNEMGILTENEIESTSKFIENVTQRMSQTINDFMNFTKSTNKKERIVFDEIFNDIFQIIGTQLENHNITVNIDIEKENALYTYKKELEHILINIIANARDALENIKDKDKEINIKAYTKEKLFVIKIADNAGGIDESIINRIFEPYFTTKETNKGTGLGLYMSKKILQEHLSGDIFVRNYNDGAEFTIIMDIENEK